MCVRHGDFKGAAVRKKDLDKAQAALDKAIAKWQEQRRIQTCY